MDVARAGHPSRREGPAPELSRAGRSGVGADRAATWVALGLLFAYRISSTIVDLDLFHQMALAREWSALGSLPRVDLYAFTPTIRPFMHHEWGAGVIAYAVAKTLGGAGILALRFALGLALALVAVRTTLRAGGASLIVAVLSPIAILLVENGFPPLRAHAYSFVLAAITLHLCERDRAGGSRWLWALVPLFVLWVNLHAGFVLGLVLLVVHAGERVLQRGALLRVVLVLAVLVAVVGLNPYGLDYYAHVLRSLGVERALVSEWAPTWSATVPVHQKLAFAVAVALVAYGLAYGRGSARNGALVLAVTAALSARHHRMLPFFGIAWLVYCPGLLRGTVLHERCERLRERPRSVLGVAGAVALAAGVLLTSAHPLRLRVPNDPLPGDPEGAPCYPVGAVAYLRAEHFRGNLLTPFNQGSYVLWKLYPAVKVSLDSRYEAVYQPALVEELTRVYQTGEGLAPVLEKYRPDAILVPRRSGLARVRIPLRKVYEDASFSLYARPGTSLPLVERRSAAADVFP